MRLFAISVVVLAGVLAAGVGVIAQSLPGARYRNDLEMFGMVLAAAGGVLFVIEWWPSRPAGRDQ